ncbi:MAG: sigma-54 dependent transcriptional regulator [Nitrospirales bacterium]|nr:sigma-54-dependent Fis family transcriptional regulator [Nitrospira sp.]MDR4459480.1 sigma-54 dependent transcriptional regulator [Nitrospirales bacterium]
MADERILVVDDDPSLLTLLKMRLDSMGFVVTACGSGGDALSRVQEDPYDFAILDLRLPDADGLDLMEELHQHQTNLPILILTAHGCIPNAVEAMKKGAYGYLTKPFDDKELLESIDKALTTKRMSQEIHRLQLLVNELYGLENVVARSAEMHTVLKQVAQVAKTDTTVCISGETGTGKEVIARVLHCNSPRASKPFMAVNCAAIPETLFESELFGHMKGSFTGAHQNKRGLIQSADKGTLFLDEIGEMPLSLQGKLLRAIQNREVVPVGGQVPVKVDVRILAATNKDLELAVREGRFREDLYYRIHVVPLWIPPLRQRREDIPSLAQFFLKRSIEHHGKIVKGFSPEAMQALITYPWPGNVRELENMIERAVVMSPQDLITAEFLALSPQEQSKPGGLQPLTDAKEAFEKEYLKDLLKATQGNISKAAQIAGRYRADFYKLLKKYGLHPSDRQEDASPSTTSQPGFQ